MHGGHPAYHTTSTSDVIDIRTGKANVSVQRDSTISLRHEGEG